MAGITKIKDILLPNGKLNPLNFPTEKGLDFTIIFCSYDFQKHFPNHSGPC